MANNDNVLDIERSAIYGIATVPMQYIWECKQCSYIGEFKTIRKREHSYGNSMVSQLACPECGSTYLTCVSLPWRLDYIDDVDGFANEKEK